MQMVAPPRCSSRKQIHHLLAILRIEVSGRLIRQQDRRITRQRPRHRNALLLTAGELRWIVLDAMRHADPLQRFMHFLLALRRSHAAIRQRQLHILIHIQIADQIESLEDEANLAIADARPLR